MNISWSKLAGWYGTAAIALAYILVSFEFIQAANWTFLSLNLSGALGLFTVSYVNKIYSLVALNIFWMLVAVIAIIKLLMS